MWGTFSIVSKQFKIESSRSYSGITATVRKLLLVGESEGKGGWEQVIGIACLFF
jgi:hypothetical protein